jgi:hypothetical protein
VAARSLSPPWQADRPEQEAALVHQVHREPRQFGQAQSRWTLAAIRRVCHWLTEYSLSGVWRVLDRLEVQWKRGRDYIHSPDPAYDAKRQYLADRLADVQAAPTRLVLLYGDELTYYRQPTLAAAYERAGPTQPLARRSYSRNTPTRVVGALNALTGRVSVLQASRIGVRALLTFYEQLCREYGAAERLYLVLDNWPIHFHPDVLAALEPQDWPWPWVRSPGVTGTPSPGARHLHLPIQLVCLPTYASWLNPIEKLWRLLKQEVLHLHPWADDLPALRAPVLACLARFADGSDDLLRYVGLLFPK